MNDHEAFQRIYEMNVRALHAYFRGRIGEPETSAELTQETLLRAWRHIDALRSLNEDQQRYWLFAVARNQVTDVYRRLDGNTAVVPLTEAIIQSRSSSEDIARRVELRQEIDRLERAMMTLPEEQRTVLVMSVLAEMTSKDISGALGIPAGTVRYRLSTARKNLAEELAKVDQAESRTPDVPIKRGIVR